MYISNPFPASPTILGSCLPITHLSSTLTPPPWGYDHTPAKPRLCLHQHDPFPFCDSLLSWWDSGFYNWEKVRYLSEDSSHGSPHPVFTGGSSSCGGIISSLSGSFYSPRYPTNYPTDVECVWVIHLAEKFRVDLTIPSLK